MLNVGRRTIESCYIHLNYISLSFHSSGYSVFRRVYQFGSMACKYNTFGKQGNLFNEILKVSFRFHSSCFWHFRLTNAYHLRWSNPFSAFQSGTSRVRHVCFHFLSKLSKLHFSIARTGSANRDENIRKEDVSNANFFYSYLRQVCKVNKDGIRVLCWCNNQFCPLPIVSGIHFTEFSLS